jgi:hypothetical protein
MQVILKLVHIHERGHSRKRMLDEFASTHAGDRRSSDPSSQAIEQDLSQPLLHDRRCFAPLHMYSIVPALCLMGLMQYLQCLFATVAANSGYLQV